MREIVAPFSYIVLQAHFDVERASDQKLVERCELALIDGSRLAAYESRTGLKFKYSYQWMNSSNLTIYRWDNTAHFPQFETFPSHRHIGPAETAEPFPMTSLREVLQFIAARLVTLE